jgi:hypothetical protein
MWPWKVMEKIKIVSKITNKFLEPMGENNIMRRKFNWIGHILGRNFILHDVIEI